MIFQRRAGMNFSRGPSSFLPAALAALLLAACAHAQETIKKAEGGPQSSTVLLNVLVTDDEQSQPVADLRQEDFQVFEGDAPQTISFFSKEDVPVSYGLLVDNSGSLRSQFGGVLEAARTVVKSNRPDDETFLVRFISSDKIQLVQDFTSDKERLLRHLDTLYVERGQTAVIDAIYVSAERLARHRPGEDLTLRRRALILITDGEERGSSFKKDELIKLLRKQNIQIFSIGLIKALDEEAGLISKSPRDKAVGLLKELAKETGGLAFFPRSPPELQAISKTIALHLHRQYVIGYTPAGKTGKGSYRKARIKLVDAPGRGKLKVVARPGYTAAG
jgi:Ca-activated chloride channel family protein